MGYFVKTDAPAPQGGTWAGYVPSPGQPGPTTAAGRAEYEADVARAKQQATELAAAKTREQEKTILEQQQKEEVARYEREAKERRILKQAREVWRRGGPGEATWVRVDPAETVKHIRPSYEAKVRMAIEEPGIVERYAIPTGLRAAMPYIREKIARARVSVAEREERLLRREIEAPAEVIKRWGAVPVRRLAIEPQKELIRARLTMFKETAAMLGITAAAAFARPFVKPVAEARELGLGIIKTAIAPGIVAKEYKAARVADPLGVKTLGQMAGKIAAYGVVTYGVGKLKVGVEKGIGYVRTLKAREIPTARVAVREAIPVHPGYRPEMLKMYFKEARVRPIPGIKVPRRAVLPREVPGYKVWHAAPRKVTPTITAQKILRRRDVPGLYAAPVLETYFLRVKPTSYQLFGMPRLPKLRMPTAVRLEVRGIKAIPKAYKTVAAKRMFMVKKAKPGVAYMPLLKREYEVVIPPGTRYLVAKPRYFIREAGFRIPISEFKLIKAKVPTGIRAITPAKITRKYYYEPRPIPLITPVTVPVRYKYKAPYKPLTYAPYKVPKYLVTPSYKPRKYKPYPKPYTFAYVPTKVPAYPAVAMPYKAPYKPYAVPAYPAAVPYYAPPTKPPYYPPPVTRIIGLPRRRPGKPKKYKIKRPRYKRIRYAPSLVARELGIYAPIKGIPFVRGISYRPIPIEYKPKKKRDPLGLGAIGVKW